MQERNRRAKIVCTVGPASQDPAVLERLVEAGMDVVRLNMSHGRHEDHAAVVRYVRRIGEEKGRALGVLMDLSGPKIRLGELREPLHLLPGDRVTLSVEERIGQGHVLPVRYPSLPEEVSRGDRLSIADGLVPLVVEDVVEQEVHARVLSGGLVSSHKGVNLPTGGEALPCLTEKDHEDLRFGLEVGVDWVALSYVRSPGDAEAPRSVMDEAGWRVPLLAKIEKRQAVAEIDGVLEAFDGLMVARGDLGVEADLEDVPGIQKDLIQRANRHAKPVITATQMLLSMVRTPRPTRAEVADVANAILDGTDAVMLSEESAAGEHPVEAAGTMARIVERAEALRRAQDPLCGELEVGGVPAAIARATWQVSRDVGAALIVTPTATGSTARLVASTRPRVPILALSSHAGTVASLSLTWGVVPRFMAPVSTTDALLEACRREAEATGLAQPGDRAVVTAGIPIHGGGGTTLLKVLEI